MHRTYVVPLDYRQALSWFQSHRPPQLVYAGESSNDSGAGGPTVASVEFDGTSTRKYDSLNEQVAIYPLDDNHSVARVDGQAVWLLQPIPDERIPVDTSQVKVVATPSDGKIQTATLTGRDLRRLSRVVNAQRRSNAEGVSCPNDSGAHDILRFVGGARDLTLHVAASGCGIVSVSVNGSPRPALTGGVAVDAVLHDLLRSRS